MNYIMDHFTININESVVDACWKYFFNNRILVVLDDENKFYGVLTGAEIKFAVNKSLKVKDICNCNCKKIICDTNSEVYSERTYEKAALIFANNPVINSIPVINKENHFVNFILREQVYWKSLYDECQLPRMHYAYCMTNAALDAQKLGYKSVSVIEFGVAGGNGLVNVEFHAREITRLTGVSFDIYGFDSGVGLPPNDVKEDAYKDLPHIFKDYDYKMDEPLLRSKLQKSKLVIGNIKETGPSFFEKYSPAPIAVMFIDVDRYSSTVPILKLLNRECSYFLPRVYMYFDDLYAEYEFQGEQLAIKEFNQQNESIKISPEGYRDCSSEKIKDTPYGLKITNFWGYRNIKMCHFFKHPKYNSSCKKAGLLNLERTLY